MSTEKQKALEIFRGIDFEKIIDHPNIIIAANFWEPDRYGAAKMCYGLLRQIDDLIDNYKAEHKTIAPEERALFITEIEKWLAMFFNDEKSLPEHAGLLEVLDKFHIPLWTLKEFSRSMIYDINNNGFDTLQAYLEYSRGASVAPASIFVHLSGLRKNGKGFLLPEFDVRKTATPCAIFSYLVHIIRDFQKDYFNNLNYFAGDIMEKHGLTVGSIRRMAYGEAYSDGFRGMIREYMTLADKYRLETIEVMDKVCPVLDSRYSLSLHIIFNLYLMVFERIDPENGSFTTAELTPSSAETRDRVRTVIENFEF